MTNEQFKRAEYIHNKIFELKCRESDLLNSETKFELHVESRRDDYNYKFQGGLKDSSRDRLAKRIIQAFKDEIELLEKEFKEL